MLNSRKGHNGFLKTTTEEQENEVIRLYVETDTPYREIGPMVGVSTPTVRRILVRNGLNGLRQPHIAEDLKQEIKRRRAAGEYAVDIAVDIGVHEWTVRKYGRPD